MSYMISASAIDNLAHELDEIRIRSLKHIEGKIFRAFQQNESIDFNSGKLISKLIFWFNKKPLIEIETVLTLILTILKSDHVHDTIKFLKKARLEKEINKIYELVKSSSVYKEIVIQIKKILENYEEPTKYDDESISSQSHCCSESVSIQNLISDDDDFLAEYEEPWSTPCTSDVTYLNMLFNSTSTTSTFEEIQNGLVFFKTAINDYPPEYFLQPPYIFKNMIKLYFKEKSFTKLLISNFTFLCKAILCRTQKRITSECYDPSWKDNIGNKPKIQITISRFCIEIFKICVEHLKQFSETIDQNEVFYAYQLIMVIFDIMNLNEYKKGATLVPLKSILIDLGILARFYRMEKTYRAYRIQYILIISIIAKLVKEHNLYLRDNDIYTSFCQNISSRTAKTADIWSLELQYAILDFPLRNLYPDIYHEIEKAIEIDNGENSQIKTILNCQDLFKPAIEILKQCELKIDNQFIFLASQAIETLSIHKSLTFVQKMIEVISNSMYLFDGNIKLKCTSEDIVLRLLAHENSSVKRTTYKEISNHMKRTFGALMNGNNNVKNNNSQFERPKSLGFPLTSEIITEIICFGMADDDIVIKKNSEIILSLILKGKNVLGIGWKNILHVLIPNFPLLQCIATFENNLGKLILDLFDPESGLEAHELIKGNLRFLFSCDEQIRSEAILRLSYILSNDKSNEEYLPNVHEIFDIIPNNLCYLQVPRDPEKIFYGGLYDCTTIPALLELLKSSDVEPSIRKTCLMQLNVLCQDIDLNKMIFNENGWFPTMQALENSLKKNPTADYPDSVVPAVSILSKMVLCNSFFRNEISCETSIYILLLRALILFHSDIALQQDAVITLFLLLYNYYIVGAEKHISIPKVLEKIYLPLKCDFHWLDSSFKKNTIFEEIFLDLSQENTNFTNNRSNVTTLHNLTSLQKDQFTSIPLTRRSEPLYSIAAEKQSNENNIFLQYIRFSFATIWFLNFDTIYKNVKSKSLNADNTSIDYSLFPGHFNETAEGIIDISDAFDFNQDLKINAEDIRLIKITVPAENLNKFLKKIASATTEKDFLKNVAGLRFCLFLGSHKFLDGNETLKIFHRFLTIKPRSLGDYTIFENTVELFDYFVKAEIETIIKWLLQEMSEKNCLILDILKDYNIPKRIYDIVCQLIETLIKYCATKYQNNKIEEFILFENEKGLEKTHYNFYNYLFEYLIPITEECFHKRYLDQVRSLLNIIQIVTKTKNIEIDLEFAHMVIKKLMYFVMALKLFNQTGSNINKNCLLIIGNLMHFIDELDFDEQHVKLLSGLCSHDDFDVRALSWCILTKVAAHLKGAHLIVKELSYLPGGFHACCISTLLDVNEVPIVRSVAGMLFANLLSHRINDTNGVSLHLSVAPLCIEIEPSQQNNGLHLIKQIFNKHHFYSAILNSIDYFHVGRSVDYLKIENITTPNIVSAYCRILSNFISFYSDSSIEEFDNEPFLFRMIGLIKIIPCCITNESLSMMSEICFLINKLHSFDNVISIKKTLCSDYGFLVAFIQLINLKNFGNENIDLLGNILQTLKLLINETLSFQIICEILSNNGAFNLIEVINFCLNIKKNSDLQNISLTLLIALLVKSDNVYTDKYKTIPIIFDSTNLSNKNEILNGSEEIFNSVKLIFNLIFQKRKAGILLKKTLICEALAMLLKTSQRIRKIAEKEQFLSTVFESISLIFENITVTCTEYIRKYGDSKKDTIIQELTILYSIILHWFCSDCLTNDSEIEKLSKVALQTWQWINHSESLRDIFLKTLAVVSENSFQVCKQFATPITSFSNSIMQLTSKMVIAETNKIKHPNIDFGILELGLGILTNCCCCIEGRLLLVKMNLLDIIGNLHPIDKKVQKSWNVVTIYWLEFWNIFSRYEQGAALKHLYILCSLIAKSKNKIRILCLKILRNMAYIQLNRPGLLSSQDFQYTVKEVLENGNEQEKFIIIITLWKLGAENFKAKHIIKNWGVLNKLKNIQHEIDQDDKENNLNCAIEIILNILK